MIHQPSWQLVLLLAVVPALFGSCRSRKKLLPRGEGSAVVMVPAGDEATAEATEPQGADVAEHEPNEDLAQAQTIELAGADVQAVRVAAALASTKDVDVYRIRLRDEPAAASAGDAPLPAASAALMVSLTLVPGAADANAASDRGDIRAEVFSEGEGPSPWLKGVVAAEPWLAPHLTLIPGGDITLRVAHATAKGAVARDYRLVVAARPKQPAEEQEPNTSLERATPIEARAATAEAVGTLGWRDDVDWYKVVFTSPLSDARLRADVTLPEDASAQVAFADDAGNVVKGYDRGASGKLVLADVRTGAASHAWIRIQNTGIAALARYRLLVTAAPAAPARESEPNDVPEASNELEGGVLRGVLHPARDADVVKVCSPVAAVEVRAPERMPVVAEVLSPTGSRLSQQDVADIAAVSWSASEGAQCHFVRIREKSGKRADSLREYEVRALAD